jgi:hypothetical protein
MKTNGMNMLLGESASVWILQKWNRNFCDVQI